MVARVLTELKRAGAAGRTDHELVRILDGQPDSIRPRRVELVHRGVVKASGRSRPTPRGRQATVWVLVEYADRTSAEDDGLAEAIAEALDPAAFDAAIAEALDPAAFAKAVADAS